MTAILANTSFYTTYPFSKLPEGFGDLENLRLRVWNNYKRNEPTSIKNTGWIDIDTLTACIKQEAKEEFQTLADISHEVRYVVSLILYTDIASTHTS